jgi:uncharacterized protein YcnI
VAIPAPLMTTRAPHALIAALLCVGLVIAAAAPPAAGHVQVRPNTAAPDDAVLFEVLVPNERENRTVELELAIPAGVLPFSYEDTPGWRRELRLNPNQSIRSIVWRGRLQTDGYVRFGFLASTPPREGEIAWKAVQTYDDGTKVRWIEPPDGEQPAAVTMVSERFPRQDAGGEAPGEASSGQSQTPAQPEAETEPEAAMETAQAATDDSDGSDTTARWLAAGALAAALASLALTFLRRRPVRPSAREGA